MTVAAILWVLFILPPDRETVEVGEFHTRDLCIDAGTSADVWIDGVKRNGRLFPFFCVMRQR